MSRYEQYDHHGTIVSVHKKLKGKHREHCLCHNCHRFTPEDRDLNCPIANKLYQICVDYNLVTPVYECPNFAARNDENQPSEG